jgi:hypothetical protein
MKQEGEKPFKTKSKSTISNNNHKVNEYNGLNNEKDVYIIVKDSKGTYILKNWIWDYQCQ